MKPIIELVETILKVFPATRNNDADLYCKYAGQYGNIPFTLEQQEWMRNHPFESISRARRKLQEEKKEYRASDEIQMEREKKEAEIKEQY